MQKPHATLSPARFVIVLFTVICLALLPDFATFKDTKAVRKKKKSPEIQGNPLFFYIYVI
jgi:hypothetical protein